MMDHNKMVEQWMKDVDTWFAVREFDYTCSEIKTTYKAIRVTKSSVLHEIQCVQIQVKDPDGAMVGHSGDSFEMAFDNLKEMFPDE